jgi:hypothetical protein
VFSSGCILWHKQHLCMVHYYSPVLHGHCSHGRDVLIWPCCALAHAPSALRIDCHMWSNFNNRSAGYMGTMGTQATILELYILARLWKQHGAKSWQHCLRCLAALTHEVQLPGVWEVFYQQSSRCSVYARANCVTVSSLHYITAI